MLIQGFFWSLVFTLIPVTWNTEYAPPPPRLLLKGLFFVAFTLVVDARFPSSVTTQNSITFFRCNLYVNV